MHFPNFNFRGRSLEGGNGGVGIDIEDVDEVIEGAGGGDEAEGVGGHRDDIEAMASVSSLSLPLSLSMTAAMRMEE